MALVLGVAVSAHAGPIVFGGSITTVFCTTATTCLASPPSAQTSPASPLSVSLSDTLLGTNPNGGSASATLNGLVDLSTFTLGASASLSLTNYASQSYQTAFQQINQLAAATIPVLNDQWTVVGGGDASGFVDVTWAIDGNTVTDPSTAGGFPAGHYPAEARLNIGVDGSTLCASGNQTGDFTLTCAIPFSLNVPIDLSANFAALLGVPDFSEPNPYDLSESSNFLNTATLTNVVITGSAGTFDAGASISDASGAPIPAVPEPGTLLLVLTGATFLVARFRRP